MRGAIKAARLCMLRHPVAISFGAASIVYSLLSLFYMGGAITDCSESLLTFPGDNTAGLIALFTVDSHDPWFGYTYYFSYPYGELIGQPTHITAQVLFVPFWILAKLLGPVCGFNLLTLMGFLSASLTMFAFIRWLFRGKFLVALLAGFAVAFTPYLQVKTGVHISYIFEALFIATIWLFLSFWREPTVKRAVCLGVSIAACAYTDGYFILLEGVLVAGLLLGALVYDYVIRREALGTLKQRVKPVCLAFGTAVVLMLPVLYTVYNSAGQINQSLVTTRDSIFNEAQVYGARPLEYLLPNALNPVLNPIFGDYESRNNHGSNPAENLLSLSLVLLGLSLFLVITLYRWRSDKSLARVARYDIRFIAVVIAAVFIVAGLTSLPPKVGPLVTPSYFLIQLVELWRVFARLGVIVNIALVILASGGLILLLDRIKSKRHRMALVLAVFVVVFVEYLTFTPPVRPVVGYERVPELYHWLSKQQAYREIAEYPLDEFAGSGNPVFYNTYQRMHGKKLLNGIISNDDAIFARQALRDLLRPQTVPGLRTLGIDFITIHSPTDPGPIPGLTLRHVSDEKILETNGKPNKVWG
ncbi:MAG TPA: hypothetical protein VFM05_15000, partial [Candidatus Saccharimonadales bacterium]|nr:hypothetical protein [Candidatus Saccharimonadales bacterium]